MDRFELNQPVVCILDSVQNGRRPLLGEIIPIVGQVYTIRSLHHDDFENSLGIRVHEIVNKPQHYIQGYIECCFDSVIFRPCRKTDIEQFIPLLAPTPTKEKESV
jgi:hypothetical protein